MRVVTLVPWRAGEKTRERNWGHTRPHLERLGYPIILGDREGPWSRAAAINAAAGAAGRWDVAVIADADTIPTPDVVHRGVELAAETGGAVRPHDRLWRLTPRGSRIIASKGPDAFVPAYASGLFRGGGILAVSRRGWSAVGGFDEWFVGWGYEDSAFNALMLVRAAWDRIEGEAYHLYHKPAPQGTPECRRNRDRYKRIYAEFEREINWARRTKGWGTREKVF